MPLVRRRSSSGRAPFVRAAFCALLAACGGGGDDGGTGPTTGSISGRVVAGSEAVPGATVALSGAASRSASTNASGDFAFAALPPGAYGLAVTLPAAFTLASGELATRSATVVAGGSVTVNWTAQRTTTGGGGGGGGGGGSNVVEVRLSGTSFAPPVIDVAAGTTVRWIVDNGVHDVRPDAGSPAGAWTASGTLSGGSTFEHTFTVAGQTYPYHCSFHQALGMTGTVRVAP